MRAETKYAARLRIKHYQITGCIGSKVGCGFYRRKPASQRIDQFAATVFTPNLQPHRKASQREDVLSGSGQPQQVGNISGIRRFESCALHAIASELENAAVGPISDIYCAVLVGYRGKGMRRLL